MHPPQDEIPLFKETSAQINNAIDFATVRVPSELEAAMGAISKMKATAVEGHVASGINIANDPNALIGSQGSSLLKILSKFNDIVGNIATV